MKRKVIEQGGKTLMVSLPISWAKSCKIVKGDELEATPKGDKICFSAETVQQSENLVEINLENLSERAIRYIISGLHKAGAEGFKIKYETQEKLNIVEDLIKNLFVGFAVVDHSQESVIIKPISQEQLSEFDVALRRAFLVTLSMGESLIQALKEGSFDELKNLLSLERTNNQLTNFCERLINMNPTYLPEKRSFLYVICWNLEKVADCFKYVCNYLSENQRIEKRVIKMIQDVNDFLRGYYELYYKFDLIKLSELNDKKKEIEKEIFSVHDYEKVRFYLANAVYSIVEFSASMTAVKFAGSQPELL